MSELSENEKNEIAEILNRRSNEIAMFKSEYEKQQVYLGSVELALSREIDRLRQLAEKIFE